MTQNYLCLQCVSGVFVLLLNCLAYFWKPTAIDGGRGAADLVAKSIAFDQCIMESLEEFNLTELSGRTTHSVEWPLRWGERIRMRGVRKEEFEASFRWCDLQIWGRESYEIMEVGSSNNKKHVEPGEVFWKPLRFRAKIKDEKVVVCLIFFLYSSP